MVKKIVGVSQSTGEYLGRKFSGLRLHLLGSKTNTIGSTAENVYIKIDLVEDLLGHVSGDLESLIGLEVKVFYNEYKKPCAVVLV